MGRELSAADVALLKDGTCPNCMSTGAYEGPGGGVSANIICYTCGARYRHGPDGLSVIHEPDEYEEKEKPGISKERADALEQAKLDRDTVFSKFKRMEMGKEAAEKELAKARMKIHDLVSASWADAVQSEATWRERALVGEKALESWKSANVALRTGMHRLLDVLPQLEGRYKMPESAAEIIREAQALLESETIGEIEMEIVRSSVGLLAGTPGACEAWLAATKRLSAPK